MNCSQIQLSKQILFVFTLKEAIIILILPQIKALIQKLFISIFPINFELNNFISSTPFSNFSQINNFNIVKMTSEKSFKNVYFRWKWENHTTNI